MNDSPYTALIKQLRDYHNHLRDKAAEYTEDSRKDIHLNNSMFFRGKSEAYAHAAKKLNDVFQWLGVDPNVPPINDMKEIDLLRKYHEIGENAKHILRQKGYGWTGLDIAETCKLVPPVDESTPKPDDDSIPEDYYIK
jgi:hypothetical protein